MTSVEFVENALIGSLLNDSTRRDELPWLRAEDFTNPLCLAIWRHLESGNPPHCHPLTDLVDLSEALGRDYELHPRLRSPAELATLQIQTPEKPAVAEYGRILVEATIRRQVAAMGLRLESLATREPKQIVDSVANALASLERLDQRWQVSMGQRAQVDVDHVAVAVSVCADEFSPPAADAETLPAGRDMDQRLAEEAVIGATVHDWPPGARAYVLESVRKSDFTDARAAAAWQAVEHLTERAEPIDEITVAWQVLRARSRTGDGLTVQELRETRGSALFHEMGAATLARSTLTRVADQAMIAISQCAQDLRIDPTALIDSVATHHVVVAAVTQRLTGEPFPSESLAAIKKRLLDRTRRTPAQVVSTSAPCERPSSYTADLRPSHISP
jgi:replicative DNA helicase